jgi:phosphate transport system protein
MNGDCAPDGARTAYAAALDDLRVQVELMGIKVDQNLERMRETLRNADLAAAEAALRADDDIDDTNVALTHRCYEMTALQQPVASDLRLLVSIVRVTSELERVGDLALRVVKVCAEDHDLLASAPEVYDILLVMADRAIDSFRAALDTWSTEDLRGAAALVDHAPMAGLPAQLAASVTRLRGAAAPTIAARAVTVGQALDRIADHARVIAARVRYLVTGDAAHLAAEVR